MAPVTALAPASSADPWIPRIYRVGRLRRELPDIVTFELAPLAGSRPDFKPGQFNMLYVFGVGEIAVSLSGGGADEAHFVHTVRDVGAVSRAITRLESGATIGVRGPFGVGWPVEAAEGSDILLVAGGLGLAPLRPAIYHVLANRARYGRVAILFGSRSPQDLLYRHELEQWRQHLDISVEVTVDHADADWRGHVGVVPALIPRAIFDRHSTVAFVCGPEVMMRYAARALGEAGVASERIYLSMERNMKCAIGLCGHCQFGPAFICRDGPVMAFSGIAGILAMREV
jgi:NAD(P)H-flavin reductase